MLDMSNYQNSSKLFENLFFYYDGLSLKRESYENDCDFVMSKIMMSIIDGSNEIRKTDLRKLSGFIPENYKEIANLRLNGIAMSMRREYDEAIRYYEMALKKSEERGIDRWLKRDIILDLRNIEIDIYNFGLSDDNIAVKKWNSVLQEMKKYDYNLYATKNIMLEYDKLESDLVNSYTTKQNTYSMSFISTYHYSLINLANALIGAIYYGSYTYIHNIRKKIGILAYIYFKESKMKELLVIAIKMLSLENEIEKIEKILEIEWEIISSEIFVNPWEIINFHTKNRNYPEDRLKKCVFIKNLSAFISDKNLKEVQSFLVDAIDMPSTDRRLLNVRREAIKALSNIVNRLDVDIIITRVKELLEKDKKFDREILGLLKKIDWKKSDINLAKQIVRKSLEHWCNVVKDFEVIEVLESVRKAYPKILQKIDEDLYTKWLEDRPIEITWYFSLFEEKPSVIEFEEFVLDLIERIYNRDKEIQERGHVIIETFELNVILFNYLCSSWYFPSEEIYEKLKSTYKKILLNRNQTAQKKAECVESFFRLTYCGDERKISFAKAMNLFIKDNLEEVLKCFYINDFASGYLETLEQKLFMLSIACGDPFEFKEILMKVLECGENSSFIVREDAVVLTNELLRSNDYLSIEELKQFLYSKTYDSWYKIQGDAIFFLSNIKDLDKLWESYILNRMKQLIGDSNSYVRSSVIYAAGKRIKLDVDEQFKDEYFKILRTGAKDNHYKLRESVEKELIELQN